MYENEWIQAEWDDAFASKDIDFKEGFAIIAAACTWGNKWTGRRIVFVTDNKPITQIWDSGTTPTPDTMALVRKLFLTAVRHQFSVAFKHISGHYNAIADAISRFQMHKFRELHPSAAEHPTPIPPEAWELRNH